MFDNPRIIGIMFWIYAAAQMLYCWCRCRLDDGKDTPLTIILTILSIILHLATLPITIVMGIIHYMNHGRTEQLHTKELIRKSNEDFAYMREHTIKPLEEEVKKLKSELLTESIEAREEGYASGLRAGFIDGFMEGFEFGFTYDDLPPELKTSPGLDVRKQAVYVYEHDIKPQLRERQK